MDINKVTLETCAEATGTVVVIDVLRAFTTAAFAFDAGACDITVVGTTDEAIALRERYGGRARALVMGEVGGRPVEGFDFGNSPSKMMGQDLTGKRMIQRTSAGTQGVVRSVKAESLLVSSFVCAGATARFIREQSPESVTFVITGVGPGWDGDEDAACADYITALLCNESPDTAPFIQRVYDSDAGRVLSGSDALPYLREDVRCCVDVDRFGFSMPVRRRNGICMVERLD